MGTKGAAAESCVKVFLMHLNGSFCYDTSSWVTKHKIYLNRAGLDPEPAVACILGARMVLLESSKGRFIVVPFRGLLLTKAVAKSKQSENMEAD